MFRGAGFSKPLSWSTSSMGQAHTSPNYNKFSPSEWSNSNVYHYNRCPCRAPPVTSAPSADQSRHQSERVRGEALRLIADRDRLTMARSACYWLTT